MSPPPAQDRERPSRLDATFLPLGLLAVVVGWKLTVLFDGGDHAVDQMPVTWKALCVVQDVALAGLFGALTVTLRGRRRAALLLVPLANLLALLAIFDARSKSIFFQPLSLDMTLLGLREWHTIAGAAKYYVSKTFLAEVALSLAALNATLVLGWLWRPRWATPRALAWAACLAPLAAASFVPPRPSQVDENVVVAALLRPLRSGRAAASRMARAGACEQPLHRALAPSPLHGAARGRNVLVFIGESWSFDDTSLGDPAGDTTPFLRELAATGPVAGQAWAQFPHSTKAVFGILMGHYATPGLEVLEASVPRFDSLARLLAARGYESAFFTSQSLRFQNTQMQYRRMGFDPVIDELSVRQAAPPAGPITDQVLIDDLDRFLPPREPFFHVIYNVDTHQPYQTPGPGPAGETDHGRYRRALRWSDSVFRAIAEKLKARGQYDKTIFVVVGDHGDNFDPAGKMTGRGCQLTRREHLVPLVIAAPGLAGAPRVTLDVEAPGRAIDIVPTLLDLLGVDGGPPLQGQSLLNGPPPPPLLSSFGACDRTGIVVGGVKYVYDARLDEAWSSDLRVDPQERSPTTLAAAEKARLVERLGACADYNLAQVRRPELAPAR